MAAAQESDDPAKRAGYTQAQLKIEPNNLQLLEKRLAQMEIEPNNLQLLRILDEGYFGDIRLGLLNRKTKECTYDSLVAVKTTKSAFGAKIPRVDNAEGDEKLRREALKDALKIATMLPVHPNVIELIGAITNSEERFCTVYEYCEFGRLDNFVREKFHNAQFVDELLQKEKDGRHVKSQLLESDRAGKWTSNAYFACRFQENKKVNVNWAEELAKIRRPGQIKTSDLLWFALQIVTVMSFLDEKRLFHKYYSLRNVLLKPDFTVRVAGFGLICVAGDDGTYAQNDDIVFPFRYTSPESWKSYLFSIHSALWTFGVVLWEIFTFSDQPYGDMDHRQVLDFLDSGKRLQKPQYSPPAVYSLLTDLWNDDPLQRPTFQHCQNVLHEELLRLNPGVKSIFVRSEEEESTSKSELHEKIAKLQLALDISHNSMQNAEKEMSKSRKEGEATEMSRRQDQKFTIPNKFYKKEELGRGGFGIVYKCFDSDSQKFFVAKETQSTGKEHLDCAKNEINRLKDINHPRIIDYFGFKVEGNTILIFMEYMAAGSLKQIMDNFEVLKEPTAIKYIEQVLEGLKHIHTIGIVHCDVKCDNILSDGQGNVKLSDFGIAVQKSLTAEQLTYFSTLVKGAGCCYWAAPEIINGGGCTRRSDIWSLGCTIVEMLNGRAPHSKMPSPQFLAATVNKALSYDVEKLLPNTSDQIKTFTSKLLQVDSERRPRTGTDTLEIFKQIF